MSPEEVALRDLITSRLQTVRDLRRFRGIPGGHDELLRAEKLLEEAMHEHAVVTKNSREGASFRLSLQTQEELDEAAEDTMMRAGYDDGPPPPKEEPPPTSYFQSKQPIPIYRVEAKDLIWFLRYAQLPGCSIPRLSPKGATGYMLTVAGRRGEQSSYTGNEIGTCDVGLAPYTNIVWWEVPAEMEVHVLKSVFERHGMILREAGEWTERLLRDIEDALGQKGD